MGIPIPTDFFRQWVPGRFVSADADINLCTAQLATLCLTPSPPTLLLSTKHLVTDNFFEKLVKDRLNYFAKLKIELPKDMAAIVYVELLQKLHTTR